MSARILVVDDTPLNVKLLAAKLMRDYYIVTTAENGLQAIEKTKLEKPDIILLDVMMPEMDGFETCRRLKADDATKHIPVVIVTALSDISDRVKGLEAGADDFLTKPINDVALMARVRSLLRLKMIMDEWRLRQATANQLTIPMLSIERTDAPATILVLEDEAHDRDRVVETLKSVSDIPAVTATTIQQALTEAAKDIYDLVIVSLDLLDEDGLMFCSQLRADEVTRSLPILLLANEGEIDRVAKGLDLGANDYVVRPIEASELQARARTQIKQKRHHDCLKHNYEQSLSLALVDPLTGAFNRRYVDVHSPRMFARYKADNRPISVLALDIDHFKKFNDTYGHAAGDYVLKEVVARVTQSVRPLDLVTRMGGEEFGVIMPESDLVTAANIGNRIREKIASTPFILPESGQAVSVTTSIGVAATHYEKDSDLTTVQNRADAALYRAKESGRNKVEAEAP